MSRIQGDWRGGVETPMGSRRGKWAWWVLQWRPWERGIELEKKEKGVRLKGIRAHGSTMVGEALVWFTVGMKMAE